MYKTETAFQNPLVSAIVTPRFAPSCSEEQMAGLGELAARHSTHIQTHMSETRPEVAWVKQLFPNHKNYCDVYHQKGLLTRKVSGFKWCIYFPPLVL